MKFNRIAKRIVVMAAGVGLGGAMALGGAVAANAAPTGCPSGATCMWKDSNYKTNGSSYQLQYYNYQIEFFPDYNYLGTNLTIDDTVSSIYNNGNFETSYVFPDPYANYGGKDASRGALPTQYGSPTVPSQFNDELSSGYFESLLPW